jgi:scyllo-inosamine-4-phosphate amidinotransferase 1
MIDSRNEWDPLEKIIVGSASHANWPTKDPVFALESEKTTWKGSPVPSGAVEQFVVDETNRELDILAETLLKLGVIVYRPKPLDFVELDGMYNYCPRDRILVAGNTLVDVNMMYPCRNQEIKGLYRLLAEANNILTMPRHATERHDPMVLDAANICRLGDTWLFLESVSGNRAAYEWLCHKFPNINIELCRFYGGVHIDSTVTPVREGLVLLNGSRVTEENCPKAFKDWEKIYINDADIVAQDFYKYPYASKWIAMNMLSVNPETVIIDAKQTRLMEILKSRGIDSIPLTLSHSRTLGGGFHCVTLDTRRTHK